MRVIFLVTIISLFIFTCSREWDNILNTDEDLKNTPQILQINLDQDRNISIILDYSYSDSSTIILERKAVGGFEKIPFIRPTQTTLVDTSFDKEINHTYVYRLSVKKGEYRSSYSDEKQFIYTSLGLNKPSNLVAVSLELQGIRLQWEDNSNYEDGYRIEKDDGSGFQTLTTVSANAQTYLDAISGIPETPIFIEYRIKAYNAELESNWENINTSYSGLGSPTNLHIIDNRPASFAIEWDDNSNIETGFSVERKKDLSNYEILDIVNANITTYEDTIHEPGDYFFRVRTLKDGQYSSYSNEISIKITFVIPTDGLVAYYPFNGNANDESGNGKHGTLVGGASADKVLIIGDNSSDRVNLPASILNGLSNFAISTRIKINSVHTTGDNWPFNTLLHGWRSSENNAFSFGFIAVGVEHTPTWRFQLNNSTQYFDTDSTMQDKKWHHVVFQRVDTEVKLFIDGNEIGEGIQVVTTNISIENLILGQEYDYGYVLQQNQSLAGEVDNLRIYNRFLVNGEIQALYQESGWGE